jgi:hypothetical protein
VTHALPNSFFFISSSENLVRSTVHEVPYYEDQVSHPYTTGKLMVVHSLIFVFLDIKLEDKRLWADLWQASRDFSLLLICSWKKFSFGRTVPKHFNHSLLSKGLLAIFMLWCCPAFCSHNVISVIEYKNVRPVLVTQSFTNCLSTSCPLSF